MTLNEAYDLHPALEQLVARLKSAEDDYSNKSKRNKKAFEEYNKAIETSNNAYAVKRPARLGAKCEHGIVSSWAINGQIQQNPGSLLKGKYFEQSLDDILSKNPSKIQVNIYSGSSFTSKRLNKYEYVLLAQDNTVVLPDVTINVKNIKTEPQNLGATELFISKAVQTMENIDKKLAPDFIQNADGQTKMQIELITYKHESQLQILGLQHANEIDKLNNLHEKELAKLRAEIEEKKEEIAYLNEELDETAGALSGVQAELDKPKEDSITTKALVGLISKAGMNLLKNNPKFVAGIAGLSQEEVSKLFAENELAIEQKGSDNTSFSESTVAASEIDEAFARMDAKVAEGLKKYLPIFAAMSFDDFKIVSHIIYNMLDAESNIDKEVATKIISVLPSTKQ